MDKGEYPRTYLPQIGSKAPQFTANTTMGPISLSDYAGQWVVLFSHPGDFTPVCTTEFMAFAQRNKEFENLNAKLIGLSVDSNSSHLAWVHNIKEKSGIEIPFPVIADGNKEVASLYGMISPAQSDSVTVRTVFIIDPDQIVRAIIYYPLEIGRYIPEIIRLIQALQYSDKNNVVMPANWLPGDAAVLKPPKTYKELTERLNNGFNCMDWYLCYTK
ncbi:MAG: peroxiredoxin [Eubacteriales bacterium]